MSRTWKLVILAFILFVIALWLLSIPCRTQTPVTDKKAVCPEGYYTYTEYPPGCPAVCIPSGNSNTCQDTCPKPKVICVTNGISSVNTFTGSSDSYDNPPYCSASVDRTAQMKAAIEQSRGRGVYFEVNDCSWHPGKNPRDSSATLGPTSLSSNTASSSGSFAALSGGVSRVRVISHGATVASCRVRNNRAVGCKLTHGRTWDDVINVWLGKEK